MLEYLLTSDATSDLDEIWLHVALAAGSSRADAHVRKLDEQFALLTRFPSLGRDRDDLRQGYRSLVLKNYVIFYRAEPERIVILRVLHGARDIQSQLQ